MQHNKNKEQILQKKIEEETEEHMDMEEGELVDSVNIHIEQWLKSLKSVHITYGDGLTLPKRKYLIIIICCHSNTQVF